jgi:hypothetical protein
VTDDPPCPKCGSDDTAPIHQEPMWASNDEPDPSVIDPPWHRCLSCRHKWRVDRPDSSAGEAAGPGPAH